MKKTAICRSLALARAAFAAAIEEKPARRFMIRSRMRSGTRRTTGERPRPRPPTGLEADKAFYESLSGC